MDKERRLVVNLVEKRREKGALKDQALNVAKKEIELLEKTNVVPTVRLIEDNLTHTIHVMNEARNYIGNIIQKQKHIESIELMKHSHILEKLNANPLYSIMKSL